MAPKNNYTEDNIRTIEGMEHIRLRPGMYIGRLGDGRSPDDGIYVLLKEIIDNSIDEFSAGFGSQVKITIEGGTVSVRDFGRGIPLGKVVDAVSIPVIAAGGIADGRQLAAALALGACGVQVGTCLLASEECPIHPNYKAALLKAKDSDTIVTGRSVGAPVRVLKNRMSREYVRQENAGADKMELEKYTLGSLRRAVFEGDTTTGSLMAGQVAGMLHEIRPVADILADLWQGGRQRIAALNTEC